MPKTTAKKPSTTKRAIKPVTTKPKAGYRIMVRSRHPSHRPLRTALSRLPFRTVVRFGSTWLGDGKGRTECNSAAAIRTSASKRLMKQAFTASGVITADWENSYNNIAAFVARVGFPIVAKHIHGSRGTGNYLIKSQAELTAWVNGKTLENYIFEKFYDYSREYCLHVTRDGCFYTCRKMLKETTPEANRWYRNDSNSVWILETNQAFDKPRNWDAIVAESVKALTAVGLDVGAIDVRVQSARNKDGAIRQQPKFIILETNSAPSFGEVTLEKYTQVIPQILRNKR